MSAVPPVPGYNQLLAHKVSPDGGRTWGEEKIDVAFPGGRLRPGMPVVAALPRGPLHHGL